MLSCTTPLKAAPYGCGCHLTVLGSTILGAGEFTTHVRTYFSGDWDVHCGHGLLTWPYKPWPLKRVLSFLGNPSWWLFSKGFGHREIYRTWRQKTLNMVFSCRISCGAEFLDLL